MWILSSPCKNRVSDRGRIDIFSRSSISGWKASLLLLALASFSVVCAATGLPGGCNDPNTCFAKNSGELKEGLWKGIGFEDGKITWEATDDSKETPSIELYSQECGKLSFIMSKPGDDCKFSMQYPDCDIVLKWSEEDLKFYNKGIGAGSFFPVGQTVNVELNGKHFTDGTKPFPAPCDFKPSPVVDKWCKFDFAFKKTGSCDGKIQLDTDYKLLATPEPTTVAPETPPTTGATVPNNANTTPGADAAGLALWIIILIVVVVLVLVLGAIGFVVFWICRRKRRRSAERMAEKGNMGSDCQCESTIPPPKSPIKIPRNKKSGSEMVVDEPSTKDEGGDGSKLASNVDASKPVSQMQKNSKNMPVPSPTPLPEENKPKRILAPDELYEPLGDPMKAIPMHLSEKKTSEKKERKRGINFARFKKPQT